MNKADQLILGTAQMGLNYGINNKGGKLAASKSKKILKLAYDSGIKFLDTAEVYGNAHQLIGSFHRAYSNRKFKIITKLSASDELKDIHSKVNHFLKDLHIDQLEGLMFHSWASYDECNKKEIDRLIDCKKNGKIKKLGVSVYTNDELSNLIEDKKIDLIQVPFNLLDNIYQKGILLQEAKSEGKNIHTRSTFLQGLFFKSLEDDNDVVKSLKPELLKIRTIARDENLSIARLALNYCIQQGNIDKVLIGVDTEEQLKLNLNALEIPLGNRLLKTIDELKTVNKSSLNPTNW